MAQTKTQTQPAAIRAINRLGSAARRRGLNPFQINADNLLAQAAKKTGLHDFGEPSFEAGLNILADELRATAKLSFLGQVAAYFNLLDYLCVRLQLVQYRKTRPEVATQQIAGPLIIVGLPRSGTTLLYELLAQDPANRSPSSWEVAIPVPPAQRASYESDRRARRVDLQFSLSEKLAPGFKAIHAIGAALPQECVYMLSSHFVSEQFGYMYNIPGYRSWCLEQDMTAAYEWHYRFLQHMQVDYSGQRWLLKTPSHLAYLKYLIARYPDANIIWTHRNPLDAVSSFSSLVTTLRNGFSDSVDARAAGAFELQHQASIVDRGIHQSEAFAPGQLIHVGYNAIASKPLEVIRSIYQQAGYALSGSSEAAMQAYLEKRPKNLYGEHLYSPEQFGICAAKVEQLFSAYSSTFSEYL